MKRKSNILFYAGLALLMIRQLIGMTQIIPYFPTILNRYGNLMLYIALGLLAIQILLDGVDIFVGTMCVLGIISWQTSENSTILIGIFLVFAARKVEFNYIVKFWFLISAPFLLGCTIAYGILYQIGSPYAVEVENRKYFLFNHCNSYGLWVTFCILAFSYLMYKKIKPWILCIMQILMGVYLYVLPNCKTAAIIMIATCGLLGLISYLPKLAKICMGVISPGIMTFSIIMICGYYFRILGNPQYFLSFSFCLRFKEAALHLMLHPLSIWGQSIDYLGENINIDGLEASRISLDYGYVALLIYGGALCAGIVVFAYFRTLYSLLKKERLIEAMLMTLVVLYGMMEWPALYAMIAFPVFLMADVYERKRITDLMWWKNDQKESKTT